ncbi:homeobox-DDT domain protein RLT3-like isoform X1 [Chenopodium quinoa]|uniref:homeobox-DDT domain protein RLT3-like isoform X1 n=1 Tax=Chenopodium quinoa TaxID=63459 RepID=UPI000B795D8B|nr:homeobox-DDT domain protein RLT3-like isoform X1 [Chenopodium quinoa]
MFAALCPIIWNIEFFYFALFYLNQQRRSVNKVQEKKKPIPQRRKVDSSQKETQKARKDCCKTALDLASHDENLCSFPTKADDEELELRELQAGPNPLTCGAHFANGGKTGNYGCSLCKGLLPKFPPESVRMRKSFHMQPWNSSLELEKKLFKEVDNIEVEEDAS